MQRKGRSGLSGGGGSWERSSYGEAARERARRRSSVFGGGGPGGSDHGIDVIFRLFLIPFAFAVAWLLWYQVINARNLAARGELTRTYEVTLHAKRGTIYDRNGNVLAISVDCRSLTCNPSQVDDPLGASTLLAEYLGGTRQDYYPLLKGDDTYAMVAERIDLSVANRLEDALEEADMGGFYFIADTKRSYPYGNVCGQVLGVVGVDGEGLSGLEYYYDDILKGEDGSMHMEVGNDGTPIAGVGAQVVEAQNGTDLVLSIDIDIQLVAEREIATAVKSYQAESGTVIVYDPRTGDILAACSTPLLDPTAFPEVDPDSLQLKPVSASYEPGSVFKLVTAAIGIEGGYVTPATRFYVPAAVEVGDDLVYDDDGREEDMGMSLTEMMRRSSNAGLATVAQDAIGADAFFAGVEAFGFGHETGIDYPGEAEGIVRTIGDYYEDGSILGANAFGQGLSIPMVQLVRAVGALAHGGVPCQPHFVIGRGSEEVTFPEQEQIVSADTCRQVIDMMRVVVQDGTATGAQVPGYDIAGKTGTGEQADEYGGYKENSFVASLVGFAPAYDAEVLVYVGLNGTPFLASASAAPTFSAIMGEALTDLGVPPES